MQTFVGTLQQKTHLATHKFRRQKYKFRRQKNRRQNIQLVAKALSLKVMATKSEIVTVGRHLATSKIGRQKSYILSL